MSPSVAARPLFFAARAWPFSLRTFRAPSTSPSDSSSARFTSIIPAAVSSRSCLIFSIVLAKVPTSPQSLRSHHPTPLQHQALRQLLVPLQRRYLPPARLPDGSTHRLLRRVPALRKLPVPPLALPPVRPPDLQQLRVR